MLVLLERFLGSLLAQQELGLGGRLHLKCHVLPPDQLMGSGAPGRDFEITEANRAPVEEIQSSVGILLREQGESEQNQL